MDDFDLDDDLNLSSIDSTPDQPDVFSINTFTSTNPVQSKTPKISSEEISKKLVINSSGLSPTSKHNLYISLGVLGSLILIGVVVVIIMITRPTNPTPSISVIITTIDTHTPKISQYVVTESEQIPFFFTSTLQQIIVYPETKHSQSQMGLLLGSTGNPLQYISYDVFSGNLKGPHYITNSTTNMNSVSKFISLDDVNNYKPTPSAGSFITDSKVYKTMNIDLINKKVIGSKAVHKNIPTTSTDTNEFSPDYCWVTSMNGITKKNILITMIVNNTPPSSGQIYDIRGYGVKTGELIPGLKFPNNNQLSIQGEYNTVLYSVNQSFLSMLFFNSHFGSVTDFMYDEDNNDSTSVTIDRPTESLGNIVSGDTTDDTSVLLTAFSSSLFVYHRDLSNTRPKFTLTDYMFLPFTGSIRYCKIDSTGTWFVLCTTVNKIVFGNISKNNIDRSSLRYIDSTVFKENVLFDTAGPCNISFSKDKSTMYLLQADSRTNLLMIKLSDFNL